MSWIVADEVLRCDSTCLLLFAGKGFCEMSHRYNDYAYTRGRETLEQGAGCKGAAIGLVTAIVLAEVILVLLVVAPDSGRAVVIVNGMLVVAFSAFLLSCVHWLFVSPLQDNVRKSQEELEACRVETRALVENDYLTGLLNRRAMVERVSQIVATATKHKRGVVVAMVDIDHFKAVNDTYGHLAGDVGIKSVASVLTRMARKNDVVARYGGEEFLVVMPGMTLVEAVMVAERMRDEVERTENSCGRLAFRLTISIGLSGSDSCEMNVNDLVKEADEALYLAKKSGRNCVRYRSSSIDE